MADPRTIVCFGDSNTWGYVPGSAGERFPAEARWPVRLQRALGEGWHVIAEGLNGRTATVDSPISEGRNGLSYLLPCLQSHAPVDLLVIFLGTNDVTPRYGLSDDDVALSVGRLVKVARAAEAGPRGLAPEILVLCPPPIGERRLGPAFAEVCAALDVDLLDLGDVTGYRVVDDDIEHLDATGHAAVADAVEERVRALLP